MRADNDRTELLVIAIIIFLAGLFHMLTIRGGHSWDGDFSMYIHLAKNISGGVGYADTGYIFNPGYPNVPRSYPPVFPLFLAPLYKVFGLNLHVFKAEVVLFFLGGLITLYAIFKNRLPLPYLASMIAVIGFSPLFWSFKDSVLSDLPFVFFVFLALFIIDRSYKGDMSQGRSPARAVAAGVAMYLAYGTRNIGIVLLPCLLAYDIISHRRPTRFAMGATAVFAALAFAQYALLRSGGGYSELFIIKPELVKIFFHHLVNFIKKFAYLWKNGYVRFPTSVLEGFFLAAAVAGYVSRLRRGLTVLEIFVPAYLTAVAVYASLTDTVAIPRYMIPLVPLYIYYAFHLLNTNGLLARKRAAGKALALLMGVILLSYAGEYSTKDFGAMKEGVGKEESLEMFEFIRNETGESDVFIFRKPRVLALYTGRSASFYHKPENDEELLGYFREIKATHLVVSRLIDAEFFPLFVERNAENFEVIFSNPDFQVYGIKQRRVNRPSPRSSWGRPRESSS